MEFHPILAVIAIIFGILVIAFSNLLSWIVGIFLVLLGLWFLVGWWTGRGRRRDTGERHEHAHPPERK
ncbi:DUF3096 domain-containing protein [Methanomassiliicoccus luminyensis]|nr:DUF3096 domain-containing protein [Methanomassiliicoccus luminyensis]